MNLRSTEPDEFEHGIVSVVDDLCAMPESRDWDSATWTRQVKNAIVKLGRERRCFAYASGCDETDGGEWLYDLILLEYDGPSLGGAVLAFESEWHDGAEDDFQKLVLAKADHRVFLFDPGNVENVRLAADNLIRHARSSRHTTPGDRYLLGLWHQKILGFVWFTYVA